MKAYRYIVSITLFMLTAFLCFSDESSLIEIENNQIIKTTHQNGGLIFATPPYWGKEKTDLILRILTDHITQALAVKVELVILQDYEALKMKTESGEIDIGFYGPTLYIESKDSCPELKYIASAVLKDTNESYYYSYLITKKESGLSTIEDLYGKTLAFGSKSSTSGYMYPRAWMHDNGIVPEDFFSKIIYLQSHNDVLNAVLTGEVDAGTVSPTPLMLKEPVPGKLFIRMRKFGPIPTSAIAASGDLPEILIKKLTTALIELPPDVSQNPEFIFSGFQQASDKFFDQMRKVIKITTEIDDY